MLAHRFMMAQQWDRSLATAMEWLGREPENSHAHRAAGQSLVNLDRASEAKKHVVIALAARPNDGFAHRLMAIIHGRLGNFRAADESIRKAISLDPNDAYHWFQLAYLSYQQRDLVTARKSVQRARELNPRDADILNLAILCGVHGSDASSVIQEYEQALALDPENANIYNNIGAQYLDKLKDYPKAEEYFRRALFFEPASTTFRKNLFVAIKHRDPVYRVLTAPRDGLLEAAAFYRRMPVVARLVAIPIWLLAIRVIIGGLILWFAFVWPMKKVYEYLTIGDLQARAGEIGARRGGFLGYRKWSLRARWSIFGFLLVSFWGGMAWFLAGGNSSHPDDRLAIALGLALMVGLLVFLFYQVRKISKRDWRARSARKRERQMKNLFDPPSDGKA
jgi:Flp pilus assembly protein TadD